jgi:hypothetical protein
MVPLGRPRGPPRGLTRKVSRGCDVVDHIRTKMITNPAISSMIECCYMRSFICSGWRTMASELLSIHRSAASLRSSADIERPKSIANMHNFWAWTMLTWPLNWQFPPMRLCIHCVCSSLFACSLFFRKREKSKTKNTATGYIF